MAKGLNTAKYARNVEEAIDFAMAAYLNAVQGKLVRANPKDTGRMSSSWNIAQNYIDTGTAPGGTPGSQVVEVNKSLVGVMRMCQAGNRVKFEGSGAWIEDRRAGEKLTMLEKERIYAEEVSP